jgi:hypothetical protein
LHWVLALTAIMPLTAFDTGSESFVVGRQTDRSALWERSGDVLSGFRNVYQFRVAADASDHRYPYKAWLFGWAAEDGNPQDPGCDAIYFARSRSLEQGWEVYARDGAWDDGTRPALWQPVVCADDRPWDGWHNGDPSVIRDGDRWLMAFSSTGHNLDGLPYGIEGDTDGSILCVGGAESRDGIHWTKAAAPLLLHHRDLGAAPVPEGEAHLRGSYHRPSLLRDRGTYRLWFDYWAGRDKGVSLGYAENRGDPMRAEDWRVVRAGPYPCLPDWPNPSVVRVGDLLYSYADPSGYDSHPWKGRKITEAVSRDGVHWLVLGHVNADADAPAIHVPEPLVVRQGGTTWMYVFYACQVGGEPYDYRYDRIRWMRRPIGDAEQRMLTRELGRMERE